jgi:OTU-like cysteine protease
VARFCPARRRARKAQPDSDWLCHAQFRAVADQLYRDEGFHSEVRRSACQQLCKHAELYRMYVPGEYRLYCERMARDGEWGDHVTLQALADAYGVRMHVITSYRDSGFVVVEPRQVLSRRALFLSFWAEVGRSHATLAPTITIEKPRFMQLACWGLSGRVGVRSCCCGTRAVFGHAVAGRGVGQCLVWAPSALQAWA